MLVYHIFKPGQALKETRFEVRNLLLLKICSYLILEDNMFSLDSSRWTIGDISLAL